MRKGNRPSSFEDRPDLYEYLEQVRREVHGDMAPKCQRCRDAGYVRVRKPIHDTEFGKIETCVCRSEGQQERGQRLRRWSGLPPGLWDKTFANFSIADAVAEQALTATRRFVHGEGGKQILTIYGEAGSGKTHLAAAAVTMACMLGIDAFFINIPSWLNSCRLVMSMQGEARYEAEIALQSKLSGCNLLILDDVGVQSSTDWATEKLFILVNERLMDGKRLIATVNDISVQDRLISRLADRNTAICLQAGEHDRRMEPV